MPHTLPYRNSHIAHAHRYAANGENKSGGRGKVAADLPMVARALPSEELAGDMCVCVCVYVCVCVCVCMRARNVWLGVSNVSCRCLRMIMYAVIMDAVC